MKNKSNKLLANLILLLSLSITVIIIFLSSVYYYYYNKNSTKMVFESTERMLNQVGSSIDKIIDLSSTLSLQIKLNDAIQKLLYYKNIDPIEESFGLRELDNYRYNASFVYSLYVYNKYTGTYYVSSPHSSNMIYSEDTFYDTEIKELIDNYDENKEFYVKARTIGESSSNNNYINNVYTFINDDLDQIVIINIKESWIRELITTLNKQEHFDTYIINDNGKSIIEGSQYGFLFDISDEAFYDKIFKSSRKDDYFIETVNGQKSLVTYVASKKYNWYIVQIIPYMTIMKDVIDIIKTSILISIIIGLLGIISSFILYRNISKPINGIMSKLIELEHEKRNNKYTLKQEFLRDIFYGIGKFNSSELYAKFMKLGINLNLDKQLNIILFKIEESSNESMKDTFTEQKLLRFSIGNIASEICGEFYDNESVQLKQGQIALLILIDKQDNDLGLNEVLRKITTEVQRCSKEFLHVDLSAVIGTSLVDVNDISLSYDMCFRAFNYQIFYENESVIFLEDVKKRTQVTSEYPSTVEKLIIKGIKERNEEIIHQQVNIFFRGVRGCSVNFYRLALTRLVLSISNVVEEISNNSRILITYDFYHFLSELNECNSVEQVQEKIIALIHDFFEHANIDTNSKHIELIERIKNMVNTCYNDLDLSVSSIAGAFNMSTAYLGRIFKNNCSISLAKYINEVRVKKAKELLDETEYSISEIVKNTGFGSDTYFYRIFKNSVGVTPSAYRKRNSF